MKKFLFYYFLSFVCVNIIAQNDLNNGGLTAEEMEILVNDSVRGNKGVVPIPDGHFKIKVPDGMLYLDKDEADYLLEVYWNNAHDDKILGVLVAEDSGIYYNIETAFVISYEEAGYVSNKDVKDLKVDQLLNVLKESVDERNKRNGTDWQLLGWAEKPGYEIVRNALYWAQHFKSKDADAEWINYDIRVLGRYGFVVIQAVANINNIDDVRADVPRITGAIVYDKDYTYYDYNPETDHVAEWSMEGLVAGKMLAEASILTRLGVVIAKGWKVIVLAIVAIVGFLTKFFRKNNK